MIKDTMKKTMKKMMKKTVVLFLAGLLMLSACAREIEEPSRELGDMGVEESIGESTLDNAADQQEGQEAPVEEAGLPIVRIETLKAVRYAEDGETELVEVRNDTVNFSGGSEKAAEAVERLLGRTQADVDGAADAMAADALENYEFMKESGYEFFSSASSWTEYEVTRLDARILSVKRFDYEYSGGAHGYGSEGGTTIDLESGLKLELPHLMEDAIGFWTKAEEVVLASLAEREDELFEDYKASVSQQLEETDWYLDGAGIEFCFTPYAIGPYASGTITVCVPYGEIAAFMKQEYLDAQGEYVLRVPQGEKVQLALDGGKTGELIMESRMLDEYTTEWFVMMDGQELQLGSISWICDAYLIRRAEGRTFLVYTFDWASDDFETVVCEVTDGNLVETDRIWASIGKECIGIYNLGLDFSIQVLGSYASDMEYRLTDDGKLEPLGERYEIAGGDGGQELLLIKDLPVEVDGVQSVVPAGSGIHIVATDNDGTAWFKTVDGSMEGMIHYERREDDYQIYIDGIGEYEYFEMLPYVG